MSGPADRTIPVESGIADQGSGSERGRIDPVDRIV